MGLCELIGVRCVSEGRVFASVDEVWCWGDKGSDGEELKLDRLREGQDIQSIFI